MEIIVIIVVFAIIAYLLYQSSMVIVDANMAVVIDRRVGTDYVLTEGVHFIIPGNDKKMPPVSMKEQDADPEEQETVTKDKVTFKINMIANMRIVDAKKAILNVEDFKSLLKSTIHTSTNNVLGKKEAIYIQNNQGSIGEEIVNDMKEDCERWGVELIRVRFEGIDYPTSIKAALEKEVVATEEKKATILKAEGEKKATILRAQGEQEAEELRANSERVLIEERAAATHKAIHNLKELMPNISNERIMEFLTSSAHIDSMKDISKSSNSKVVLFPSEVERPMDKLTQAEYLSQRNNK